MPDLIGQTLGSYRIISQIGAGGMASVYKAYQPSMDRYVAIKVLPPYLLQDEQFARRFQREAKAVARLEHAHILPVHDYGEAEGITYLVMRFVEGGTLKQRIAQRPLPLSEIARLIGQIGDALDYAHRLGVIHRDVKPANVLIDDRGNTYLTDFGLARMMEASDQLTASGVGVGTPAYMSPEQGQGVKVDHRSDIYSLGVILYEMVTGHVPYEAETPMAVMLKHITEPLPLPRSINPNVPEPVERVILKALAKDPAHRYQTAGEMAEALTIVTRNLTKEPEQPVESERSVGELGTGREGVSLVTRLQRTWAQPRGKAWLIGGATVLLAALGLLLSRLPGQVQITTEQLSVASREATATSAAVAAAPTATSAPTQATQPAPVAIPTAPCRIAYVDKTGSDTADIFVQDCDGSNWQRVTEGRISAGHEPAWSPDGQRLVFDVEGSSDQMSQGLYIVNADGSNLIQLVSPDGPVKGAFPTWSPDGTRIAFMTADIYTIHPDGSNLFQVVKHQDLSNAGDSEMYADRPMWSPDSQRIAFATFPATFGQVTPDPGPYKYYFYVVNADGTGLTRLASITSEAREPMQEDPVWSPDGSEVAFAITMDDKTTVKRYRTNTDGSGEMIEIESIPESWYPWHWPQWGGEAQTVQPASVADQARAFAEPILTAIANRPPDYQDDLSDPSSGWPVATYAEGERSGEIGYKDGEYFLIANPASARYPAVQSWLQVPAPDISDFVMEFDARVISAGHGSIYVHFRVQEKNVYAADVAPDGRVRLATQTIKGDTLLAETWGSPLKRNEVNHVRIIAEGSRIALYLNDRAVLMADKEFTERGGTILGIWNGSSTPMQVNFDNFTVWDISKQPVSAVGPQAEQARAFAEPILQAIANRKPDFEDDFSTAGNGWGFAQQKGSGIQDGVARLSVTEGSNTTGNTALNRKDFVLQVDARVAEGDKATQLIVNFHNLSSEYWFYVVVHSAGNTWLIDKNVPGDQRNLANGLGNVSSFGEPTRIMIVARGPHAAIYLNSTPVAYFEDADFDTSGGTGLFCQSLGQAVCEFDNVKFWNLADVPALP